MRRIALPLITVVGVAPDLHMAGPQIQGESFEPAGYYRPLGQDDARFMTIVVLPFQHSRTGIPAIGLSGSVSADGFTMSFAPMTTETSTSGNCIKTYKFVSRHLLIFHFVIY